jgi:DNA-binding transcriptional regulator YiaG
MKLDEYLKANGITAETFAKDVGHSVFAVGKWRRGERVPRNDVLTLIKKITKGKVTADDFSQAKAETDKRRRAA